MAFADTEHVIPSDAFRWLVSIGLAGKRGGVEASNPTPLAAPTTSN